MQSPWGQPSDELLFGEPSSPLVLEPRYVADAGEGARGDDTNIELAQTLDAADSLVMRVSRNDYSARLLQQELLSNITSEFEHNIAQQTYMSTEAWEKMKAAKNQIINLINETASELKPDAKGPTLGKLILERLTELKNPPSQVAIDFLKQEVKTLFF